MKRLLPLACMLIAAPASAALPVGSKATDFITDSALKGDTSTFSLKENLKHGPVVLYFYPKAFTTGCTIEAHEFAEASDDFAKLGAKVIGASADDIDSLKKFSVEECRNKFAVAVATPTMIANYDAAIPNSPRANRISYVITPDHKIIFAYADMNVKGHVSGAMQAVKDWRAKHPLRIKHKK